MRGYRLAILALFLIFWGTVAHAQGAMVQCPGAPSSSLGIPTFNPLAIYDADVGGCISDLSMSYLGAIFGNNLVPSSEKVMAPSMNFLANLFQTFNQVALVVGIMIIIYTIIVGTMNTAAEGKPLGEKWNSVWMPIRMVMGVGLLVPKAGSGYCMAQYIVFWMVTQGIGAADQLWITAVNYFEAGGSIKTTTVLSTPPDYHTSQNYSDAYNVAQVMLESYTCVQAYNQEVQASGGTTFYTMYTPLTAPGNANHYINFGDPTAYAGATGTSNQNQSGYECGQVVIPCVATTGNATPYNGGSGCNEQSVTPGILNGAYTALLTAVRSSATDIATAGPTPLTSPSQYAGDYPSLVNGVTIFMATIAGGASQFSPPAAAQQTGTGALATLKKYGWLLAGNYYSVLANWHNGTAAAVTGGGPQYTQVGAATKKSYTPPLNPFYYNPSAAPGSSAAGEYYQQVTNAIGTGSSLWSDFSGNWGPQPIPGSTTNATNWYPNLSAGTTGGSSSDLAGEITSSIQNLSFFNASFATGGLTRAVSSLIINGITGGSGVSADPIQTAANYGYNLMSTASSFFTVGLITALISFGAAGVIVLGNGDPGIGTTLLLGILPAFYGLFAMMYMQGAMLSLYLPVIPMITFLTAGLGWMLAVVESIAAAPIVALGLIFPEAEDQIWGKAKPAYMMILNLFLRPSLTIIGFCVGMIISWISIDLLNMGFAAMVEYSFQLDFLLGWILVGFLYAGMLATIVTKAYSTIIEVPNKVLSWIGDNSMQQAGPGEALQAAHSATKAGAEAGTSGVAATSSLGEKSMKGAKDYREAKDAKEKEKGGADTEQLTANTTNQQTPAGGANTPPGGGQQGTTANPAGGTAAGGTAAGGNAAGGNAAGGGAAGGGAAGGKGGGGGGGKGGGGGGGKTK